jgi:hypothetical protein
MAGAKQRFNLNGEFLSHYNQGLSDHKIARLCGCHESTITHWRAKQNLPTHYPNIPTYRETNQLEAFNYKDYIGMIKKAVQEAGINPNSPEGRSYILVVARRTHDAFYQEFITSCAC